jgi:hypothetical protein
MKKILYIPVFLMLLLSWGCNDDEFLNRPPTNILTEEQVWGDEGQVLSVLGNLYNRYYDIGPQNVKDWLVIVRDFNEAFWSNAGVTAIFKTADGQIIRGLPGIMGTSARSTYLSRNVPLQTNWHQLCATGFWLRLNF